MEEEIWEMVASVDDLIEQYFTFKCSFSVIVHVWLCRGLCEQEIEPEYSGNAGKPKGEPGC